MTSKRKIHEAREQGHVVKVYWSAEFSEYTVRLDDDAKSDYFTTDKQDAKDTAATMLKTALKNDGVVTTEDRLMVEIEESGLDLDPTTYDRLMIEMSESGDF